MRRVVTGLASIFVLGSSAGCGVSLAGAPAYVGALSLPASGPQASADGPDFTVTRTIAGARWDRIERLTSNYGDFPAEQSLAGGKQTDPDVLTGFGTDHPPSRDVLLHYYSGWKQGVGVPVLLVHGALADAGFWLELEGKQGLVPYLAALGFRVFALTFAHKHGDNLLQSEQLANCLARIRQVTGASQVDVVAHSKGTVAARALCSGMRQPWMTPFQGDVRRLVLVASPNLGIDYTFRHPSVNYGLWSEASDGTADAPMSWSSMVVSGLWLNTEAEGFSRDGANYFPGQAQLLYRLDGRHPLSMIEPDWYTSYNGGSGFVSVSGGIDSAIASGGHFIDNLRRHPIDARVALAVLAGSKADLKTILNENTGPSDGLVFVDSATYTDDLTRGGAPLLAKTVLPLNHVNLVYDRSGMTWIGNALAN